MKVIRVCAPGLRPGTFELDEDASHYVSRVHRLKEGAELELFDPDQGIIADATLSRSAGKSAPAVVLVGQLRSAPDQSVPITLAVCLGKGDKPEQALRDATVLGASTVVLLESERVQGRHFGGDEARFRKVMLDTARQSGRASLPRVQGPLSLEAWLGSAQGRRVVLSLTPNARPFFDVLLEHDPAAPLALVVGPEGGFSGSELTALSNAGFEPVSLGPLVLRAETAVTVALGIVRASTLRTR